MADRDIKNGVKDLECPVFETPAFTTPPPLEEATVALVTSASLHHPDQENFAPRDATYRVLDGSRRDYLVGHWSPNFDTAGVAVDLNVVFPIDRLDELAAQGRIGKVADRHLAYAGNQWELSQIRFDGGPAGAAFLRQQGVDVVLLTPV
ncbi:MAG: glycine/sarcosine/betaine reductase selenoprotein B family protein [Candidatus Tectomicrobia bacterium]